MHKIIENLLSIEQKLVVFLWGDDAQLNFLKYISNIEIQRNLIIFTYNHPSRLNEINGKHFNCCEHFDITTVLESEAVLVSRIISEKKNLMKSF